MDHISNLRTYNPASTALPYAQQVHRPQQWAVVRTTPTPLDSDAEGDWDLPVINEQMVSVLSWAGATGRQQALLQCRHKQETLWEGSMSACDVIRCRCVQWWPLKVGCSLLLVVLALQAPGLWWWWWSLLPLVPRLCVALVHAMVLPFLLTKGDTRPPCYACCTLLRRRSGLYEQHVHG